MEFRHVATGKIGDDKDSELSRKDSQPQLRSCSSESRKTGMNTNFARMAPACTRLASNC